MSQPQSPDQPPSPDRPPSSDRPPGQAESSTSPPGYAGPGYAGPPASPPVAPGPAGPPGAGAPPTPAGSFTGPQPGYAGPVGGGSPAGYAGPSESVGSAPGYAGPSESVGPAPGYAGPVGGGWQPPGPGPTVGALPPMPGPLGGGQPPAPAPVPGGAAQLPLPGGAPPAPGSGPGGRPAAPGGGRPFGPPEPPSPPPGPGVQPPFVAAPLEGRRARTWLGLGIAGGLLALCCGAGGVATVGLLVLGERALTEQAERAVGDYLAAISEQEWEQAYELRCARDRANESLADFQRRMTAQPRIEEYRVGEVVPVVDPEADEVFRVTAEVSYDDGTEAVLEVPVDQDPRTGSLEVCGSFPGG